MGKKKNEPSKPSKAAKDTPPKVIKVENPVQKDGYVSNLRSMLEFGKKFAEKGGSIFQTRPMTLEEANARLKAKQPKSETRSEKKKVTKKLSKKKEESDDGQD